jgi:hypothetical protein
MLTNPCNKCPHNCFPFGCQLEIECIKKNIFDAVIKDRQETAQEIFKELGLEWDESGEELTRWPNKYAYDALKEKWGG